METDFSVRSAGPRTLGTGGRAEGRYADMGRLLICWPDRPGIAAAVSSFPFSSGASITGSQQYTDPFDGTFFLRIEFHLDALAKRCANLASTFGEPAGKFSMSWKMRPEPGPPTRVRR